MKKILVKYDPNYPHFGIEGDPIPHKQHQNQQKGLDLYIHAINFDTGERCFKKLYDGSKGLHFKHSGYSPMYLSDFSQNAWVIPFQVEYVSTI